LWIFGDETTSTEENPVHTYLDGDFTATLIASNACASDTIMFDFTVFTSTDDAFAAAGFAVHPNPASDIVWITRDMTKTSPMRADLFAPDGRRVAGVMLADARTPLAVGGLAPGRYVLVLSGDGVRYAAAVVKG
jgi:hypothetical protein